MINIKRLLKGAAWLLGIFVFIWMLVWVYVLANKKSLISKVSTELNNRIKGEIIIRDFEPSLISTFPHVALRLTGFAIRDSMWKEHHHDLLKAENAFVRLGLFSLFTGNLEIKKVVVQKGAVYLFSDTTGYSNSYMFSSRDSSGKTGGRKISVPDVEMNDMRITLDLRSRSKLYDFDIHRLNCRVSEKTDRLQLDVKTNMLVHALAFNTDSGSFVREKPVEGNFTVDFYQSKKKLEFKEAKLRIDDHPFVLSGMFDLSDAPPLYFLSVKTDGLDYKKGIQLVSQNLGRKLADYNIEKPVDIEVVLDGTTRPNRTPWIKLDAKVRNSTVSTPKLTFTDASFDAHFDNKLDPQKRPVNNNSGFSFLKCSGTWENIPVESKQITLIDLDHPVMTCDIRADVDLKNLNNILGSNAVEFTKGNSDVDITFRGPVMPGDTAAISLHGTIGLKGADINYIPRNLPFTNSSGSIQFNDKDVYVKDLRTTAANSPLVMNGSVKNFISLIDKSPEKMNLNWNISSSRLNLGDFIAYLGKSTRSKPKKNISALIRQIDRMLEDGTVDLQLRADRLIYKKFDASNVAANLQLGNNLIALKRVAVQHAGGTITMNGTVTESQGGSQFTVNTNMNNVNVPVIFRAFDNFEQDGITDKNIKGRLDAEVKITGLITSKAGLADNSLKGGIDFNMKEGELIDFEPIEKISAAALNNKGVSSVQFADLKNRLDINGSAIKVNRMEIRSSLFTMFVEGLYDLRKGTDLSIQVPLNNLTKSKSNFTLTNKGVKSKTGVSVWLRAKTGDNGRAKISWDPFKKGRKEREKNSTDSTNQATPDAPKLKRKQ